MTDQLFQLLKTSFSPSQAYLLASLTAVAMLMILCTAQTGFAAPQNIKELRRTANKIYQDGNYQQALELYLKLLDRKDGEPGFVGNDLNMAINCLNNVNRQNQTDELREKTIKTHKDNLHLLWAVAQSYLHANHSGYLIAGKFERGSHRGGGKYANAMERDRVRALQLMVRGMKVAEIEKNKGRVAGFYQSFAGMWLVNRYNNNASWELQALTNLDTLPDYEEGYPYNQGE
ncbi:MAG: hypothetical protein OEM02_12260, partial [Desulfobulbaceae bacterium]|nr:hypothetical protein [Desulfobulbaceae bacterium]